MRSVKILYEDDSVIVVVKPAGMLSQNDRSSAMDMVSFLRNHLHRQYIGVVHRLDRNVGGVMVYALTKEAAADLSSQAASGGLQKRYKAVVTGRPAAQEGELTDYLVADRQKNFVRVADKAAPGAKKAVLRYKVNVEEVLRIPGMTEDFSSVLCVLDIELLTGRQHQIRVQTANAGFGILGDIKYNKERTEEIFWPAARGVKPYLFACGLSFRHPVTGREMTFTEDPEWE
ncbi:MAG: RluA family pseudouridine synthase [Lachnospiraceae bacterium]|nr:RluA family pseudouridine synthase [Lachnospiraceae bacterium]